MKTYFYTMVMILVLALIGSIGFHSVWASPITESYSAFEKSTQASDVEVQAAPDPQEVASEKKEIPFEPVPSDQVQSIANRMEIAKQILIKHGRAYDYRTLTTAQLKEIQAKLSK